ncbi:MAG TPA: hypothetical protein PLN99_07605 [Daejeonella sp.]|uniref:hypothetical protein n=2 Tax=Daejeonella sp. TaxID=2805397 RepID=UPI002C4071EF|nr:hypothetical protein [Daejeonella sp.]HQS51748.1 hypothetical protein [Daejeonella sp.]HQT24887.1 hypothetical protein [Daejeonella sp.]
MAKSNYLPRILLAGVICICGCIGSYYLVVGCRLLVVSNNVVQKKFCNPRADQRAKNKESGRAGLSMNNRIKNLQPITYNLQLHLTTKKIYDSQIGVREQGINTGPQVEEYLNYVNLKRGQPWCAAFICWVYGQANVDNPRTGWSPDLFKGNKVIWDRAESVKLKVESREKYQVEHSWYQDEIFLEPMSVHPTTNNQQLTTKSQQPTTADIFGLFFPEKNRIAHAGFVDQWDGTWLITVEGNTNVSGGREGDGVYRKRRLVKSVYQVARYIGVPYS